MNKSLDTVIAKGRLAQLEAIERVAVAVRANGIRLEEFNALTAVLRAALDAMGQEWRTGKVSGVELVAAERQRQIDQEGYRELHDDSHDLGQMANAAACYAMDPEDREFMEPNFGVPGFWPWHSEDWKPTPHDRVRELVKAGALIAAEIDRLGRTGK